MKIKIFIFLLFLLYGSSSAQNEYLTEIQIESLNKIKSALNSRKAFVLTKQPAIYYLSVKKLNSCDSLIIELKNYYPEKIDIIFYDLLSESIDKELKMSKEDITKISKGKKSQVKIDGRNYRLTQDEQIYLTFLIVLEMKIDDKLKMFTE